MAMDLNHVCLIGRLTRDPELRTTANGITICNISIAVNGMRDDDVSFIDVVCFNKTAELVNQYLNKGRRIAVDGNLQQQRWEDQNGQKRSKVNVVANRVQFLDSGQADGRSQSQYGGGGYQSSGSYQQDNQSSYTNNPSTMNPPDQFASQQPTPGYTPQPAAPQPSPKPQQEQQDHSNDPPPDFNEEDDIPF